MEYLQYVIPINPIPWKTPPFAVGRTSAGKTYVRAGRNQELAAYQQAVREAIASHPQTRMLEPPYFVQFWFSRRQDEYTAESGRKSQQHEADVTNMQKATEDALQGLVIGNDNDVVEVYSHTVEQGPEATGLVVIEVWGNWQLDVPTYINEILLAKASEQIKPTDRGNTWPPTM